MYCSSLVSKLLNQGLYSWPLTPNPVTPTHRFALCPRSLPPYCQHRVTLKIAVQADLLQLLLPYCQQPPQLLVSQSDLSKLQYAAQYPHWEIKVMGRNQWHCIGLLHFKPGNFFCGYSQFQFHYSKCMDRFLPPILFCLYMLHTWTHQLAIQQLTSLPCGWCPVIPFIKVTWTEQFHHTELLLMQCQGLDGSSKTEIFILGPMLNLL